MQKRLIALTGALLLSGAAVAQNGPSGRVKAAIQSKPSLEMVFVIDTTGSMGGLIEGAKQRVWGIVNDVMKSPAHPAVKIGLVAYRDHGDEYVTKVLPLTSDLDKVYSTLMDYKADGGGDTPEDVRQALADGVHKAGWSQRSPSIAQIMFLVGDAPPHDDYVQEPDTLATTAEAVRRGIIVNTIECGSAEDTRQVWQRIAGRGEGEFFAIAQDGGVQNVATPYDKRLAELGTRIGSTYLAFGGAGMGGGGGREFRAGLMLRQREVEAKVARSAPTGAAADRAANKALNHFAYEGDLLTSIENGSVKLNALKKDELPDDLQKLSPEARQTEVDHQIARRKAIQSEIMSLSKKRDAYVAEQRRKQAASHKQTGFDAAVAQALRKEAGKKGIRL